MTPQLNPPIKIALMLALMMPAAARRQGSPIRKNFLSCVGE
jgi:hypothetical protein